MKKASVILAVVAFAASAVPVSAATTLRYFDFSISSFGGVPGGTVTGSFSGIDADDNGGLEYNFSAGRFELASFAAYFSGFDAAPPFILNLSDFSSSDLFFYRFGDTSFSTSSPTRLSLEGGGNDILMGAGFICNGTSFCGRANYQSVAAYSTRDVGSFVETNGAVPEPATWAMMLTGFGLIGGLMRRKQRQTVRVTYA